MDAPFLSADVRQPSLEIEAHFPLGWVRSLGGDASGNQLPAHGGQFDYHFVK